MTAHDHKQFVEGCYRCDLGLDEMDEYTPTTEEIREYVETGGEPRPWVALDDVEEAREKARAEAFDRWLRAHDAEVLAEGIELALAEIFDPEVELENDSIRYGLARDILENLVMLVKAKGSRP